MHHRRAPLTLPLWTLLAACGSDPTNPGSGSSGSEGAASSGPGTGEPPTTNTDGPGPTTDTPTTGAPGTTDAPTTAGPGGETDSSSGDPDTTTGAIEGGLGQRPADPIVLLGGQLPGLGALAPADIVGFAWRDGAWAQIPIQVDERVRIDFCTIYAKALLGPDKAPCKTSKVIDALFYADPATYTGPDSDPKFDLDDELVFMARDAGGKVGPGSAPAGVVAGSAVEVELNDGDETGWVYLFERSADGGLEPGAGADLISYTLSFDGDIDYKTEYPFVGKGSCGDAVCDPPVLEDSLISSPHYERHFSARWVTDSLRIHTPGSTGEDLLDLAQARFAPDYCGRHVLTFSTSEGAFVANIDGPVRAIRSYLGANSGPLTQRTHLFYDRVEVIQTFLRVHAIPAIMDLVDLAADAPGMTYYNEHNEAGLAIDGVPDPGFSTTAFTWELISGPHGSVVSLLEPRYSTPLNTNAYYEDDANTPNNQCSASNTLDHPDDEARGTAGMWIVQPIPDTDPRNGSAEHVFIERTSYYEAPDLGLAEAKALVGLAKSPPKALARSVGGAVGEPCGDGVCGADEADACPNDCNPFTGECNDGLCDPWENSVSCAADCATGMLGAGCGDQKCDAGEHELNCSTDCWVGPFGPLVACMAADCSEQHGACSDEPACVDRVVCTAECVGGGGPIMTCQADCATEFPATPEQTAFANALLLCTQQQCL